MKNVSTLNNIKENTSLPLVYAIEMVPSPVKMIVSETTDKVESNYYQIEPDAINSYDRFDRCYGNAKIEQNGLVVINGSDSFFGTEIRGKIEYISGQHELRLQIVDNPSKVWIFIGIISKEARMGNNLFTSSSVYGWGDYNDYFLAGHRQKTSSDVLYTRTLEGDIIQLIIDCTKQKLCYKNERSGKSQEICVDTNKCPFPWQLYLSLGGRGDQINLCSTSFVL